jgi:thiol-disulfide isomerase/thioredoxin
MSNSVRSRRGGQGRGPATPSSSRRGVVVATVVVVGALVAAAAGFSLIGDSTESASAPPQAASASSQAASASSTNISTMPVVYFDESQGTVADYAGQPLVLNFFASWCVPCLKEMPGFERVYQSKGGDVAFLGMNLQDTDAAGVAVVEQTGVTYDMARDRDGSLFTALGGFAMPTTLFIDEGGNLLEMVSGELSAEALDDKINLYFDL